MSPHTVNNFVSDLVDMAKAVEELPKVRDELNAAQTQIETLQASVAMKQMDLEQAKGYAASLEAKLHDAEVAKDAAETMFLEADDRTSRALDFVKATFGTAGALIQALEPPKATPTESVDLSHTLPPQSGWHGDLETDAKDYHSAPGQSEPDPTVPVASSENGGIVISTTAETTGNVSPKSMIKSSAFESSWASPIPQPNTPPTPVKPYEGKKYSEVPGYVQYSDWLEGGGTAENYYI